MTALKAFECVSVTMPGRTICSYATAYNPSIHSDVAHSKTTMLSCDVTTSTINNGYYVSDNIRCNHLNFSM